MSLFQKLLRDRRSSPTSPAKPGCRKTEKIEEEDYPLISDSRAREGEVGELRVQNTLYPEGIRSHSLPDVGQILVVDDELQLDEHPELHRLGLPIFLVAELYQIEAMDPVMQQAVVAVRRQIPRSRLANVSTGSVSETIDPITGEVVGWACPHQTAAARYAEANRKRAIRCIDCFLGAHPWGRPRRRREGAAPVR